MATVDDPVVDNPTYLGNIRYFFRDIDIDHMQQKGIDLGTYDGVKDHAVQIYSAVTPPAYMPPDEAGQWSANRCQTFLNWMTNNYPMGTAPAASLGLMRSAAAPERMRNDVDTLSDAQVQQLATAFQGLMERDADPANANSYFAIAGLHGVPKLFCQHHNDPFNPWHRVYLKMFEDQLRTIPGCEDVTLPYWDISKPMSAWLGQGAFKSYTLPRAIGPGYPAGYTTKRNPQNVIDQNLKSFDFFGDTNRSLAQTRWGVYSPPQPNGSTTGSGYQQFSIQAHDSGHVAIGPTMAQQDVASYDPIFWFYHCNLDRYWLSWQETMHATDWTTFQSLLDNTKFWKAPLNVIKPFTTTTDQTIAFGIGYEEPVVADRPLENKVRSLAATSNFTISSKSEVAVRVEAIQRMNVPGSFVVHLLADGQRVASRAFFQPNDPRGCSTCVTIPDVSLEFRLPADQVLDRALSVAIEVPGQEEIGAGFPLRSVGSPRIKASLLLDEI